MATLQMKIDTVHAQSLTGNAVSSSVSNHTVVSRDGNGGIWASKLTSSNLGLTHDVPTSARTSDDVFYSSDGNNIYKNTAAGLKASLGLNNVNNTEATVAATADKIVLRNSEGDIFAANVFATSHLFGDNVTVVTTNSNLVGDNVTVVTTNSNLVGDNVTVVTTNSNLIAGNVTVDSNLIVNTNDLVVDTVNSRVGIGTLSPACKLDIASEDVMIRGSTPSLNFSEGTNGMDGAYRIRYDGANESNNDNFLAFQTGTSFGVTSLHMTYDGNVGIGTTSPVGKLDVWDGASNGTNIQQNAFFYLRNPANAATNYGTAMVFENTNGSAGARVSLGRIAALREWNAGNYSSYLQFSPSNNGTEFEAMRIASSGNVGIGTTTPNVRFDVQGAGASPVSSGTSSTAIMRARATNTNVVLDQGAITASPWTWWMQVSDSTNLNLKYPLALNPIGGYVGIGTDDPERNLHVHNDGGHCWVMIESSASGGDAELLLKSPSASWSIWNNGSDDSLRFYRGSDRVVFDGNGNCGFGITTPLYPIHISGSETAGFNEGDRGWIYYGGSSTNDEGYGSWNCSLYATNSIITKEWLISHTGSLNSSDGRIKKNIVDADDAECLETLRLLKPKKYQYRDVVERGEEPVWGFIAQEVANVLPHATQLRQEFIPNIYELANVSSSNVITFTGFNAAGLESNATTLIRTKGIDGKDHDIHLAEVIDTHTIRVEEDLTEWIGSVDETGNVVAGNQLFVRGQEVDDFVYLKKESIFTVATAALQEVDRQQQADKARISELETQLASVLTRLNALENA